MFLSVLDPSLHQLENWCSVIFKEYIAGDSFLSSAFLALSFYCSYKIPGNVFLLLLGLLSYFFLKTLQLWLHFVLES